jgi:hypothetical protein
MEVGIDTNIEEAGKSEDCAVSDGREVDEYCANAWTENEIDYMAKNILEKQINGSRITLVSKTQERLKRFYS